jgi:hypothetical protein
MKVCHTESNGNMEVNLLFTSVFLWKQYGSDRQILLAYARAWFVAPDRVGEADSPEVPGLPQHQCSFDLVKQAGRDAHGCEMDFVAKEIIRISFLHYNQWHHGRTLETSLPFVESIDELAQM